MEGNQQVMDPRDHKLTETSPVSLNMVSKESILCCKYLKFDEFFVDTRIFLSDEFLECSPDVFSSCKNLNIMFSNVIIFTQIKFNKTTSQPI